MQVLNRTWRRAWLAWALLAAVVALPSEGRPGFGPAPSSARKEITVGALLSLTGPWSSLGIASRSALAIAARDLNATFAGRSSRRGSGLREAGAGGEPTRVEVVVQDTKLDPDRALRALAALDRRGVKVVIGPQSSAEVRVLKPYADQHGMVLISQGSTASSLAIAGDNVFRFVPDDTHEAAAIAALLREDGIHTVIPFGRDDAGNQDLSRSVKRAVEASGGVVTDGVHYAAATREFSAELQALKSQVSQAVAQSGAGRRQEPRPGFAVCPAEATPGAAHSVAVFLGAFDEAATIFRGAGTDPVLSSVRWYGTDGLALSNALLTGPAAQFAAAVGYPCPTVGLDDADAPKWKPVADQIRARTGLSPDALALSAYDALGVAVLAAVRSGGTSNLESYKKALVETAASYDGITGSVALNEAGDRASGNYDFWAVRAVGTPANNAFQWTRVAGYRTTPFETVTRLASRASGGFTPVGGHAPNSGGFTPGYSSHAPPGHCALKGR